MPAQMQDILGDNTPKLSEAKTRQSSESWTTGQESGVYSLHYHLNVATLVRKGCII